MQYKFLEADGEWRPTHQPHPTIKGAWVLATPDVIYQVLQGPPSAHVVLRNSPLVIQGEPVPDDLQRKILDCARQGIFSSSWTPTDTTEWKAYFATSPGQLADWYLSCVPKTPTVPSIPSTISPSISRSVNGESIVSSDASTARAWVDTRILARKEVVVSSTEFSSRIHFFFQAQVQGIVSVPSSRKRKQAAADHDNSPTSPPSALIEQGPTNVDPPAATSPSATIAPTATVAPTATGSTAKRLQKIARLHVDISDGPATLVGRAIVVEPDDESKETDEEAGYSLPLSIGIVQEIDAGDEVLGETLRVEWFYAERFTGAWKPWREGGNVIRSSYVLASEVQKDDEGKVLCVMFNSDGRLSAASLEALKALVGVKCFEKYSRK